jgi:hypothetical protein
METVEKCPVCNQSKDKCICCPECGHICMLDEGEYFCPVCKPNPKEAGKEQE